MMLGCGQADVNVRAQWARYILTEQCADASSRDAAHEFTRKKAESVDVIAMRRSGLPPRSLCREGIGHRQPIHGRPVGKRFVDRRQARLVRK